MGDLDANCNTFGVFVLAGFGFTAIG